MGWNFEYTRWKIIPDIFSNDDRDFVILLGSVTLPFHQGSFQSPIFRKRSNSNILNSNIHFETSNLRNLIKTSKMAEVQNRSNKDNAVEFS